MRILLHDNSGHPFPIQLARFLAGRGAEVLHLYSAGFHTPRGRIEQKPDDPATMEIRGIDLGEPFRKY
ncbi:MAG: glycosyltransferase WbuB, partial [Candidatus Marinimicrobia bacterium]|nr:glycosyltransferase WbuB [Candidatus Neomarinimicrobiota bacterium]